MGYAVRVALHVALHALLHAALHVAGATHVQLHVDGATRVPLLKRSILQYFNEERGQPSPDWVKAQTDFSIRPPAPPPPPPPSPCDVIVL